MEPLTAHCVNTLFVKNAIKINENIQIANEYGMFLLHPNTQYIINYGLCN